MRQQQAKPIVLVSESERFSPDVCSRLEEHVELRLADLDRAALIKAVADVDVLWVRLRNQIDAEIMDAAGSLKWIVTATTGLNHIDMEAAESRGITVLSLKGHTDFLRRVCATAEHTMALIFALLRNLPHAADHVRAGGWDRDLFRGSELDGKTVGIVGYGRLGRLLAGYLSVFGVRILATDKPTSDTSGRVEQNAEVTLLPLDQLLSQSHIVSLHVDYTRENRAFFGKEAFAAMKRGAFFINTARGELLDETALLDVLNSGHLAGAALDVLADERATGMSDHPLVAYARRRDNLIITPHIGGCTRESMEKTEGYAADLLLHELMDLAGAGQD